MIPCAQCAYKGGVGWGHADGDCFTRVCMQNYSGSKFIAPSQVPILGTSTAPCTTGKWGDKLHGSCGSTTSQPQLISGYWLNHILVKRGSSSFVAMSKLKFMSTTRSSFTRIPSTERIKGEQFFHYLGQCLLCLYLFSFFQQYRRLSIGSYL